MSTDFGMAPNGAQSERMHLPGLHRPGEYTSALTGRTRVEKYGDVSERLYADLQADNSLYSERLQLSGLFQPGELKGMPRTNTELAHQWTRPASSHGATAASSKASTSRLTQLDETQSSKHDTEHSGSHSDSALHGWLSDTPTTTLLSSPRTVSKMLSSPRTVIQREPQSLERSSATGGFSPCNLAVNKLALPPRPHSASTRIGTTGQSSFQSNARQHGSTQQSETNAIRQHLHLHSTSFETKRSAESRFLETPSGRRSASPIPQSAARDTAGQHSSVRDTITPLRKADSQEKLTRLNPGYFGNRRNMVSAERSQRSRYMSSESSWPSITTETPGENELQMESLADTKWKHPVVPDDPGKT